MSRSRNPDDYRNYSEEQLEELQQKAIREQDHYLAEIYDSVLRMKRIAKDIGTEIDLHNSLLTEVTAKVDRATPLVEKQTRRIDRLRKMDASFCTIQ